MESLRRKVFAVVAVLALVGGAVVTGGSAWAGSGGGNSHNAHLCQQGGWMQAEGADGTQFSNNGACASYGAHGGTIVPIVCGTPLGSLVESIDQYC